MMALNSGNKEGMDFQTKAGMIVSILGGFVYGYNTGIIGGLSEPMVKRQFFPDLAENSQSLLTGLLTSCILVGAFAGSFLGVPFANKYGRRTALGVTGALGVVSGCLLGVFPNYAVIIVVRTVLGLSVGFAGTLCPLYVDETAAQHLKARLGTVFQIAICGAILVAQVTNWAFNTKDEKQIPEWKWRAQLGLGALPALALFVWTRFIPESPAWPVRANKDEQDEGHVGLLHAPPGKSAWSVLLSLAGLKWVVVAFILAMCNQLTGINAIIFYAPKIFQDAGFSNTLVLTFSVVGGWNLISVFGSFVLVDRFGRRTLMLATLLAMCIATGLMSLAYAAFPDHKAPIAILSILLFVGAFELGPGPLFFLMATETFPSHLRDPALSLANGFVWGLNILVSFGFPVINDAVGPAATFGLFAATCALSILCVFVKLPETKYIALHNEPEEEVQQA